MATPAFNHSDPSADNDEFLIVDRLDHSLSKFELEAKIFNLREEILFLKSWKNSCEKFQEKFFELFIAFTVLVTPLAIAFVFNYVFSSGNDYTLTRDLAYNCTSCSSEWENFSCVKGTGGESAETCADPPEKVCCLMIPPSATTSQHIRDAVVPVLIAISFIVGLPYYYHMLDELSHSNGRSDKTQDESDDDDSGEDGDEEDSDTMWEDDDGKEKGKNKCEKGKGRKISDNGMKTSVTAPEPSLVNID